MRINDDGDPPNAAAARTLHARYINVPGTDLSSTLYDKAVVGI